MPMTNPTKQINNLAPMNRGLKPKGSEPSRKDSSSINNLAPMNRGLKLGQEGSLCFVETN